MADRRQKLELTWIGKDERPRLEPRILLEDPELSYHAATRISDHDLFDNMLIHGDNLLALKALEQEFAGKIKCACIDPPYNTGSAFTHYDDGLEHSTWLSLMRDRLELLKSLLSLDGSIWITIDDHEMPYLRLLLDEVFGRSNFVGQVVWQKVYSVKGSARFLSEMHDYVIVYARDASALKLKLLPRTEKSNKLYKNPDNDPRGPWRAGPRAARNYYGEGTYSITCPSGRVIEGPPKGSYWRYSKAKFEELDRDGRIWWGSKGGNVPAPKLYLAEVKQGVVPSTIWFHEDVGHNQDAKKHLISLLPEVEDVFITPKPERLVSRIIQLCTDAGDWVLDSFAGSGTTGATAHKLGRRWIMVELGDHCHTHVIPRIRKVVDGEDPGGISAEASWSGGGGFRYFRLAPSLLEKDQWSNWVVSRNYNPAMLAEAVCKLEGFRYEPDPERFWLHGRSTETDFLYVTTQNLSRDQLQFISDEVGSERTLLICCGSFRVKRDAFDNLTLKKIPQAVLHRCEWGRDDYSLNVQALPPAEDAEDGDEQPDASTSDKTRRPKGRKKKATQKKATGMQQLPLFDGMRRKEGKR